MPSWQSKALPNPPKSSSTNHALHGHPGTTYRRSPSSVPAALQDFNSQSPASSPSGQHASKHSRSLSHPFPSIFGPIKKSERQRDFDFEDEDIQLYNGDDSLGTSPGFNRARRGSTPSKDANGMSTGRCMTCDSTVRWPADLDVFRCTICLTINDLSLVRSGQPGMPPLSVAHMKSLIASCIHKHIRFTLKDGQLDGGLRPISPPQSPVQIESMNIFDDSPDSGPHTPPIYLSTAPSVSREYPESFKFPPSEEANPLLYSSSSPGAILTTYNEPHRSQSDNTVPLAPYRPPPVPPKDIARPSPGTRSNRNLERPGLAPKQRSNHSKAEGKAPAHAQPLEEGGTIFHALDDYVKLFFSSHARLNTSFYSGPSKASTRPMRPARPDRSRSARKVSPEEPLMFTKEPVPLANIDAKTLLIGDIAENGSWWTGKRQETQSRSNRREISPEKFDTSDQMVNIKSPLIDWDSLHEFYALVLTIEKDWKTICKTVWASSPENIYQQLISDLASHELAELERKVSDAAAQTQRVLLRASESLLRRPGRPLRRPSDVRFIFIIMSNPLLYRSPPAKESNAAGRPDGEKHNGRLLLAPSAQPSPPLRPLSGPGQHSGITKRLLGILAALPNDCHRFLVSWFSHFSDPRFAQMVELVGSFVTYRLTRQHGRKISNPKLDPTEGLVPNLNGPGAGTPAHLRAAIGPNAASKKPKKLEHPLIYEGEWQIKAAAKVMALLFSANDSAILKKYDGFPELMENSYNPIGPSSKLRAKRHGQILPTSSFYNTLLDYSDLLADFESWESRKARFAFCQYPFFLSIWAKIRILEFDAKRQMEVKAREAFFSSLNSRTAISQFLILRVRRNCLVEDSMRGISEVVGAGQEEIKKGLRIDFLGEEGIDAGGLKKEWFLLLTRDIFDPHHGLFVYDEDSNYCYFNPFCFETSDQFFLVGALMGLAIYNSTILDVALPPFAFRKLLSSAHNYGTHGPLHSRTNPGWTLDDLAELRPSLASGLRQMLDFEGNVEETFCRDFVAEMDKYGEVTQIPLCVNGEKRAVTNTNRREFVNLYVQYLLDAAVARQFEPFKRGFFTVCGGNALSLFRSEEIELLIRGSDEPLDVLSLKAVAHYENWGPGANASLEPVVCWFWTAFEESNPKRQRKLLSFITGSDRIPAMGAASLVIKLSRLGDDSERFPAARTCFNMLQLYRYRTRAKFERKLWTAVEESEGFGLK
ncbi:MAG: putative E3 ubiquitin-protein ligase [Vezdaea aestivalis]|nr:MAG: putative E3 ubiquitin-protein ligase [Vezdaea aestivalis]